ncbi:hypothetical protein D3C75_1340040 [compost metagenome]
MEHYKSDLNQSLFYGLIRAQWASIILAASLSSNLWLTISTVKSSAFCGSISKLKLLSLKKITSAVKAVRLFAL